MGGLCARSCARGATRNSTTAAQIWRMAHGLTSEHEMVQDFLLVSEELGEGGVLPCWNLKALTEAKWLRTSIYGRNWWAVRDSNP
jgi:hypothetical protein